MERMLTWAQLSDWQREIVVQNYAAIREAEEEKPCDLERAKKEAPLCHGYWVDDDGGIECDI